MFSLGYIWFIIVLYMNPFPPDQTLRKLDVRVQLLPFFPLNSILFHRSSSTEFHLCGWLPSCLYTCTLNLYFLKHISACLLCQVSFHLPALPGEDEIQGLWADSVAGRASPGRHKLPGKGSSSMHRFMAGNACPRIVYNNDICKDL